MMLFLLCTLAGILIGDGFYEYVWEGLKRGVIEMIIGSALLGFLASILSTK